jgi:hypothetical protein
LALLRSKTRSKTRSKARERSKEKAKNRLKKYWAPSNLFRIKRITADLVPYSAD